MSVFNRVVVVDGASRLCFDPACRNCLAALMQAVDMQPWRRADRGSRAIAQAILDTVTARVADNGSLP